MAADILAGLLRANIALAAAIFVILIFRGSARVLFGARAAYALWIMAPLAALGSLLPARRVLGEWTTQLYTLEPRWMGAREQELSLIVALWIVGALAGIVVLIWRQHRFVRGLGAIDASGNSTIVTAARSGVGPALVGTINPRIVVPGDFKTRFDENERAMILAHEHTHLARGDAQTNALLALAACVCWFNPLIHIAAALLREDQELACDAQVIGRFAFSRRAYAEALLKTQLEQAAPLGCAWPATTPKALSNRIAALWDAPIGKGRRYLGAGFSAFMAVFMGAAAWGAQPPKRTPYPLAESRVAANADWPARPTHAGRAAMQENTRATVQVSTRGAVDEASRVNLHLTLQASPANDPPHTSQDQRLASFTMQLQIEAQLELPTIAGDLQHLEGR